MSVPKWSLIDFAVFDNKFRNWLFDQLLDVAHGQGRKEKRGGRFREIALVAELYLFDQGQMLSCGDSATTYLPNRTRLPMGNCLDKRKADLNGRLFLLFFLRNCGAEGGTRTRTRVTHYPLKIACLPVPPPRRRSVLYTEPEGLASVFAGKSDFFPVGEVKEQAAGQDKGQAEQHAHGDKAEGQVAQVRVRLAEEFHKAAEQPVAQG